MVSETTIPTMNTKSRPTAETHDAYKNILNHPYNYFKHKNSYN